MPDSTQILHLDKNLQQPSFQRQGAVTAPAAARDAQIHHEQIALPRVHTQYPDLNMTSSHFFSIRTLQNTTSLNPTNISTKKTPKHSSQPWICSCSHWQVKCKCLFSCNAPASSSYATQPIDKHATSCSTFPKSRGLTKQQSPVTEMLILLVTSSIFLSVFCLTEVMNKDLFQP